MTPEQKARVRSDGLLVDAWDMWDMRQSSASTQRTSLNAIVQSFVMSAPT